MDTVEAYIAARPKDVRVVLEKVRTAILKALPKAEERISYKIPAYKIYGRDVIYFAAWPKHWSIYPATKTVREGFAKELEKYEVRGSTVRFSYEDRVPVGLIGRIAKFRAKEQAEKERRREPR